MESKPIQEMTYEEASNELETILEQLKNNEVSIDALDTVVTRAAALSKLCQEKLRKTEHKVHEIVEKLGL